MVKTYPKWNPKFFLILWKYVYSNSESNFLSALYWLDPELVSVTKLSEDLH